MGFNLSKYIFDANGHEIYWDSAAEDIVMLGELGEERIPLREKLKGLDPDEREGVIHGMFLHTLQAYIDMQFDGDVEFTPSGGGEDLN